MFDMSGVVIAMSSNEVVRTRRAAGSYPQTGGTRGTFVAGAASTATIVGSMQPIAEGERKLLPEGLRYTAKWVFWTVADVRDDDPATSNSIIQGDLITYNGEIFQVHLDQPWGESGNGDGQFRKCILYSATMEP